MAAEVHGPLDENHYVIDFIVLRDTLRELVLELDHHMLLPERHPTIRVVPGATSVEVTFEDRRWVFPRGDCVILPVENTTAELLARYLAGRLLDALEQSPAFARSRANRSRRMRRPVGRLRADRRVTRSVSEGMRCPMAWRPHSLAHASGF